jgi:DNA-binding transcriptional MerR regulator
MSEKKYTIKEAAKEVEVEAHVLRYWEEELDMKIKRNEMGHRYYEENDVKLLKKVKELKDRGIQLKAIRELVSKMYELIERETEEEDMTLNLVEKIAELKPDEEEEEADEAEEEQDVHIIKKRDKDGQVVDFKLAQFQTMMNKVVGNSIKENIKPLSQAVSGETAKDIVKQMDVLMKEREEREEIRYRKLDNVIREMQMVRKEIAAASLLPEKKKKKIFARKSKNSL